MTIISQQTPQPGQQIIVYSEKNNYPRGAVEKVRDTHGALLGQAVCAGNFGDDPRYTRTANGKTWRYGRFYHKFIFTQGESNGS